MVVLTDLVLLFYSKELPLTKVLSKLLFDQGESSSTSGDTKSKTGKKYKSIVTYNITKHSSCLNNCLSILNQIKNELR